MKQPLLERLRDKPKEYRVQFSFLTALCVTGVVGVLWGVTLPVRLASFPQFKDVTGAGEQAQSATALNSFFADTRKNVGELVNPSGTAVSENGTNGDGSTGSADGSNDVGNTPPKSDAYTVGAPPPQERSYFAPEKREAVVVPIDRREVRIGTTTNVGNNATP